MAPKLKQIKKQSIGQYFIAVIDSKKYTVKAEKELKDRLKKEIDAYNIKNTKARLELIVKLLSPKQEAEKLAIVTKKKVLRNKSKETKRNLLEAKNPNKDLMEALDKIAILEKSNQDQLTELAKLKEANEKLQSVKKPEVSQAPRRSGEY